MARKSTTGQPGLTLHDCDKVPPSKEGKPHGRCPNHGRYLIDWKWKEIATGEVRRYSKVLPAGIKVSVAKKAAKNVIELATAGGWNPDAHQPRTLHELLDWYLSGLPEKEQNRTRKSMLRVLKATMRDVPLPNFSTIELHAFRTKRLNEVDGPTFNRGLAFIKRVAVVLGKYLSADQREAIRTFPKEPENPGRTRTIDETEWELLVSAMAEVGGEIKPIVVTSLLTGLREGDCCSLRKDELHWDDSVAQKFGGPCIVRVMEKTRGRGRKVVTCAISEALAPVLREALARSPEECPYVFVTERKHRGAQRTAYTTDGFRSNWYRVLDRAGLDFPKGDPRHLVFHDMRRTYAVQRHEDGADLKIVSRLLGHTKTTVTEKHYTPVRDARLHAAGAGARLPGKLSVVQGGKS